MKHIYIAIIPLLLLFSTSQAVLADNVPGWGDQGNGTYINPVLDADFSDPDVIRVGNKYYMVASDFHFIGMQVLESDDMVNWTIISQVYSSFDFPGWDTNSHYAGGSWAPSLRYHDGKFWVFFCTPDEGLLMSNATDPHGPWSELHCVNGSPKWEDPCPLWDDDGQAYMGRSKWRAGPIIVHRMSPDGKSLLDEGKTVYEGPVAEGTKFLKRNGYYYLIIPEGGVEKGWQTVLRSRNIYGPYERKIVLHQGNTDINGPHQGALVDTPDGEWWFYHFQSTTPNGRVVHLQPAFWRDDWPYIGIDSNMDSIGEPVRVWTKPNTGVTAKPSKPQTSDDFNSTETHWVGRHQSALGLQWQWNHNPHDDHWSLSERKGWLTLHAMKSDIMKDSHNMLTQKTMGEISEAVTEMDCRDINDNTYGGLLCIGKKFYGIGVCRLAGMLSVYLEKDGERQTIFALNRKTRLIYLKVNINNRENTHRFSFSTDGKSYKPAGEMFSMSTGYWKGTRLGLYCYNTNADKGACSFDYFKYQEMK